MNAISVADFYTAAENIERGMLCKKTASGNAVERFNTGNDPAELLGVALKTAAIGHSVPVCSVFGASVPLYADGVGALVEGGAWGPSSSVDGAVSGSAETSVGRVTITSPNTLGAIGTGVLRPGGGSSSSTPRVAEFTAGNQVINHGRFWGGSGAPAPLEGNNFFWDCWAAWDAGQYLLSDGWGGAHALLWGGGSSQSGNVLGGPVAPADVVSFGGMYTFAAGEWAYRAVGCDGSYIYTFVNGIPDGRVPWVGTRHTNGSSSDGFLLIGGPFDHQMFEGRIAWVRGFDVNKWPLPSSTGYVASFIPERFPSAYFVKAGAEIAADFLADYAASGRLVADLSSGGARGKRWPGAPYSGAYFNNAPGGSGAQFIVPAPRFVSDPTCPLVLSGEIPASGEVARTPGAVPPGALAFDSFERSNQTYAFQTTPTLGSTEGGSLGTLAWQTGNAVNARTIGWPSNWGILGGYAVMLEKNQYPVAWINAGVADHWVHVDRHMGAFSTKATGVCFRLVDENNFWFLSVESAAAAQVFHVEAGVVDITPLYARVLSATTTQVSIRCVGNSAQLYEDGIASGAAMDISSAFAAATRCGIVAPFDGGTLNGCARFKNFLVKAA